MSLLAEQQLELAAEVVPKRRSTWGLPVLAATLALTGLVITAGLAVPRVAAISVGSPTVTGAPFVSVPEYGSRGGYILGYRDNGVVEIALPIRNEGPLPVTISRVRLLSGPAALLTLTPVEDLGLRLGAGQTRTLSVTGRLSNCRYSTERDLQTYTSLEVRGSTLGRGVTRTVTLDRPIYVKSPTVIGCPDRKLNRSAVNRSDLLSP